jgi:hypothetical protein
MDDKKYIDKKHQKREDEYRGYAQKRISKDIFESVEKDL